LRIESPVYHICITAIWCVRQQGWIHKRPEVTRRYGGFCI